MNIQVVLPKMQTTNPENQVVFENETSKNSDLTPNEIDLLFKKIETDSKGAETGHQGSEILNKKEICNAISTKKDWNFFAKLGIVLTGLLVPIGVFVTGLAAIVSTSAFIDKQPDALTNFIKCSAMFGAAFGIAKFVPNWHLVWTNPERIWPSDTGRPFPI